MQSRVPAGASTSQPQVSTPQRPSQAWRAQTTRSPADPSVLQKRPRTPSPPPTHAIASGRPTTPKQRRIEGESGTRTRTTTPALTPSQRAARQAEIERGLAEGKKLSRIASIQEALSAVKASSQAPSGTSPSGSLAPPQASPAGSSRIAIIEAALHDSRHHHSDLPPSPSPSSASQARALPMAPSRPPQSTQSEAGYSISSEIEDAELDDLEDKAIQTDPYDDEESIIEDFFQSAPASAFGSPVVYATALSSASADVGSGSSRPSMSRMPDSEPERGSWLPAPPPLTPGRGRSMRTSTPGGNEGGMLLTPPGTSQTGYRSANEHGLFGGRHGAPQSPSPSPAKGKGREMPRSPSWGMGSPQWQMIQDDPENPFHERAPAPGGGTPASIISGTESLESAGSQSVPLSADAIESQVAALANVPEYVRRLERRERAALNSADIKSRRIAQLEDEVQRLRNEKRALEETVAALQVRR